MVHVYLFASIAETLNSYAWTIAEILGLMALGYLAWLVLTRR